MAKSRLITLIFSLTLVVTLVSGFLITQTAVFADNTTPTPTPTPGSTPTPTPTPTPIFTLTPTPTPSASPIPNPTLTLDCQYPILDNDAGNSYAFSVNINYAGLDKKTFNLTVNGPSGWTADATAGYPSTEVSVVQIIPTDPSTPATQTITVNVSPNQGSLPDPGNYITTLNVSSGSLSQSIDLKAVVTATHSFTMSTDSGDLTTQATAGQDNHFSFNLTNTGSASLDKINLTSTKPEGWVINFTPSTVSSLGAGQTQQIDAVINPPGGKTIAGDYMVTLKAATGTTSQTMDVRVTVPTSTIWGLTSIIIIVVVIAGLAVLLMKLDRR